MIQIPCIGSSGDDPKPPSIAIYPNTTLPTTAVLPPIDPSLPPQITVKLGLAQLPIDFVVRSAEPAP